MPPNIAFAQSDFRAPTGQPLAPSGRHVPRAAAEDPLRHTEHPVAASLRPEVSAHPIRSVSLEFGGQQHTRVSLSLVEREGQVEVAVRSPDTSLNRALRGELTELLGRMHEAGFEAQELTPGAGAGLIGLERRAAESAAGQTDSRGHDEDAAGGRRHGGGNPQERGNGNRDGGPEREPEDGETYPQPAAWQRAWSSHQQSSEVNP